MAHLAGAEWRVFDDVPVEATTRFVGPSGIRDVCLWIQAGLNYIVEYTIWGKFLSGPSFLAIIFFQVF
jgi:hypothetical protein